MDFHPLANLFPLLEAEEFEALVDSIRTIGQQEPIVIYEDKVLDGRNRYRGCLAAGVEPVTIPYTGKDPIAFVIGKNLRRRHLDTSQRSMIAAELMDLKVGDNQHTKELLPNGGGSITLSKAAELMNVGTTSVSRARTIKEEGDAVVIDAVKRGERKVASEAERIHAERALNSGTFGKQPAGARLVVPEGKTASEVGREGMALEKQGHSPDDVAAAIGVSRQGYTKIRDMLLLAERADLAKRDVETARTALAFLDETRRLSAAYDMVQPLVEKIWGKRGFRGGKMPSADVRRRRQFEKAVSVISGICERALDVVIPHMNGTDAAAACKKLEEAQEALGALIARIKEERK